MSDDAARLDVPPQEDDYRETVRASVRLALADGRTELGDVLPLCEGADPRLVTALLEEEQANGLTAAMPRRVSPPTWTTNLPASDPERSQWWFSAAGHTRIQNLLRQRLALRPPGSEVLLLGAPSLALTLSQTSTKVTVFDSDPDVIDSVRRLAPKATATEYDVALPLSGEFLDRFDLTVIDPPWYPDLLRAFISRAQDATRPRGEIVSTLPPRLTRPGTEALVAKLIAQLAANGDDVLEFQRGAIGYQVPTFEFSALRTASGFRGIPWRVGDLLHFCNSGAASLGAPELAPQRIVAYSRQREHFRVFLRGTATSDPQVAVKRLEMYSSNVSTRAHYGERPDVWTSEKDGILVSDAEAAHWAVLHWSEGKDAQQAQAALVAQGRTSGFAALLVTHLDDALGLWKRFASAKPLRSAEEVQRLRQSLLEEYATPASVRLVTEPDDAYRPPYNRDRDRVLWSAAFRRLSDKTQLFPATYDDDLRRRLTHSVEVMQLASTIAASFGLDSELVEAGALAHDIGHTPFGHAGEHALDVLMTQINPDFGGFNHYEHGLDTVRYLEGPYSASGARGFDGLNLSPEVDECIIKHAFCHGGERMSSEELVARSKHTFVPRGHCHLEGQAVRLADKISYLISDLEDGIRLNAITHADLVGCRFFHRAPLDFSGDSGDSLAEDFRLQRRIVLKLLMEDAINTSGKRLALMGSPSVHKVRAAPDYMIQHSDEMLSDIDEIWNRLQSRRLHRDRRVVAANLHAARIVSTLTVAFCLVPELIDLRFRQEYERLEKSRYMEFYKASAKSVEIKPQLAFQVPVAHLVGQRLEPGQAVLRRTVDLIMAKDYVAGLTDSRARGLYNELVLGQVEVST